MGRSQLLFNCSQAVAAYILGTLTALAVSADTKTKTYRTHMHCLDKYTRKHSIPGVLQKSMKDHLEVGLISSLACR